jgi:hypothetical protein
VIEAGSETTVLASPDQVFEKISDVSTWERWLPMHGGWPDGRPTDLDEGTRFRQRLGHLGIYDIVTVTVTENRASESLVLEAAGNYGASARFAFVVDPTRGGLSSRVRVAVAVEGKLARPLAVLAKRGLAKGVENSVRDLAAQPFWSTLP